MSTYSVYKKTWELLEVYFMTFSRVDHKFLVKQIADAFNAVSSLPIYT